MLAFVKSYFVKSGMEDFNSILKLNLPGLKKELELRLKYLPKYQKIQVNNGKDRAKLKIYIEQEQNKINKLKREIESRERELEFMYTAMKYL